MKKTFMIYVYDKINLTKRFTDPKEIKFFYSDNKELPIEALEYINEIINDNSVGRCIMKVGLSIPKNERGILKDKDYIWSKNKYYIINEIIPKSFDPNNEYNKFEYNPDEIDEKEMIRNWKKSKMEKTLSKGSN